MKHYIFGKRYSEIDFENGEIKFQLFYFQSSTEKDKDLVPILFIWKLHLLSLFTIFINFFFFSNYVGIK